MKIAINSCFGGFGLSKEAVVEIGKRKGLDIVISTEKTYHDCANFTLEGKSFSEYTFYEDRTDKDLVEVIELLGEAANGSFAKLRIVEIPDDIQWKISDYDGIESVEECHRSWS